MASPDTRWGDNIEDRLDSGDERMERIEADLSRLADHVASLHAELQRNTVTTTEVRDLLDAAKGAFRALDGMGRVLAWVGRIAAAGVAIWGAIYAITHGGRPPGGQ